MAYAIQSSKYSDYYRIPDSTLGLEIAKWRAPVKRVWGKRPLIDLLIELGMEWNLSFRTDSPPPVLVGDVSPEGGASKNRDPVKDHSSHKTGVDVDIYVFRLDGKSDRTSILDKKQYDQKGTLKMIELVFALAQRSNVTIDKFFFNDAAAKTISPIIQHWPNHEDHFHMRIKI